MSNILIDTGFWYSYLGTRQDSLQGKAIELYDIFISGNVNNIIIPFPVLYETINTKLLKDKNQKAADWFLKKLVSDPKFIRLPDKDYRETAFNSTIGTTRKRGISLVDNILRAMLADGLLKIDALITFNTGDFSDVCKKQRIQLIDQFYISNK